MLDSILPYIICIVAIVLLVALHIVAMSFDISSEEHEQFLDDVSSSCGLTFSLRETWNIWEKLPSMNMEETSQYADEAVKHYVNSKKFYDHSSRNKIPRGADGLATKEAFWQIYTSSFGNIAYMAIHAPTKHYKNIFTQEYEMLKRSYDKYNGTFMFKLHKWWCRKKIGL